MAQMRAESAESATENGLIALTRLRGERGARCTPNRGPDFLRAFSADGSFTSYLGLADSA